MRIITQKFIRANNTNLLVVLLGENLKEHLVDSYINIEGTKYLKNEDVFDMDYVPDDLVRRDDKIEELFGGLAKSVHGKKSTNDVLIYGPQGTGKTVSLLKTKELLEEVNDERDGSGSYFYVSGRGKTGLIELLHEGLNLSRNKKHNSAGDYFSKLETITNNSYVVLMIDDFDKFENDYPERTQFLLTKIFDMEKVSLVLVSNSNDLYDIIMKDMSNFSRMRPVKVEFDPYEENIIKEILLQRAEYLKDEVYDDEIIDYIVESSENGDARMAIEVLKIATQEAEKDETKITKNHVDTATERYTDRQDLEYISRIQPQYIAFLEAAANFITEKDKMPTVDDIMNEYEVIANERNMKRRSKTTLYRYAKNLDEQFDIVNRKTVNDGKTKRIVPLIGGLQTFLDNVNNYYNNSFKD